MKCVWGNGSTNPKTKKHELADQCKKQKCDGKFKVMCPLLDQHMISIQYEVMEEEMKNESN